MNAKYGNYKFRLPTSELNVLRPIGRDSRRQAGSSSFCFLAEARIFAAQKTHKLDILRPIGRAALAVRHLWRMEAAGLAEPWKAGDTGDCVSRLLWPFVLMIKYCFNVHSPLECFFFTEI